MTIFSKVNEWQAIASGQVRLQLEAEPQGICLHYDFAGQGGFAVARLPVEWQLPARFRLRLRLRGEGSPNRFEIKLCDHRESQRANVWWYQHAAEPWPADSTEWVLESPDFSFAWGPAGGGVPQSVAALEFAIVAGEGGAGRLWLQALEIEDLSAIQRSSMRVFNQAVGERTLETLVGWQADSPADWLQWEWPEAVDLAAVIIEWEHGHSPHQFVLASVDDEPEKLIEARQADASRHFLYVGTRKCRRLRLHGLQGRDVVRIRAVDIVPPERARNHTDFLHEVAARLPRGTLPRYLSREQCYWTVIGAPDCPVQALLNADGMIEVQQPGFSLEAQLLQGQELLGWATTETEVALAEQRWPLPRVSRRWGNLWLDTIGSAVRAGGRWCVLVHYQLRNAGDASVAGQLLARVRPWQVTPPWQTFHAFGGVFPIRSLQWHSPLLQVNEQQVVLALTAGHTCLLQPWLRFDDARLTQQLRAADSSAIDDAFALAQAVLAWPYQLAAGATQDFYLLLPFDAMEHAAQQHWLAQCEKLPPAQLQAQSLRDWNAAFGGFSLTATDEVQQLANVLQTATAHILVNRAGVALQPGPRRYARSWIRDGATMGAALLRMGHAAAVAAFVDWYAPYLREDGYVPCCVDANGADPLVEHDSHGQWLYLVTEVTRFWPDPGFRQRLLPTMKAVVEYLCRLREQHAGAGLLPESVSHEGYLAQPVHAYWDDFWAWRGLLCAAEFFSGAGDREMAARCQREADALRPAILTSINAVMQSRAIDFLPGSVEWADFDPTATACAVAQLDAADWLPQEALATTYQRYLQGWRERQHKGHASEKYSAYDIRIVGALLRLGWHDAAHELLAFLLRDMRPPSWQQWPEISWPDPHSPGHLGDLPHSWIGAEAVLAIRALFVTEQAGALVLGQGIKTAWLQAGVEGQAWHTPFGVLDFVLRQEPAGGLRITLTGTVAPPQGIVLALPGVDADSSCTLLQGERLHRGDNRLRVRAAPAHMVISGSLHSARENNMASLPASLSLSSLPPFRLLTNGHYQVLAHPGGCTVSRFERWALNDWVWDGLAGYGGMQIYVQELASATLHRVDMGAAPWTAADWSCTDSAVSWRYRLGDMTLTVSLALAAQQPLEIRTLELTLPEGASRDLALTVFVPVALNDPATHESHPAFSKLFVQTAFMVDSGTLIARRRARGSSDPSPCMLARLEGPGELDWESDRIRFIGRGCTLAWPAGIRDGLTRSVDNVLDPCFALQRRFSLAPGQTLTFRWLQGAANDRAALHPLLTLDTANLALQADTNRRAELDTLLGAMTLRLPQLKPAAAHWQGLQAAAGNVWGYGVPTDRPFVLLLTDAKAELDWAADAHRYWQSQGVQLPILVLGYDLALEPRHNDLLFRQAEQVPEADIQALLAGAALVCGSRAPAPSPARGLPVKNIAIVPPEECTDQPAASPLLFDNRYGGFSADGREYVIRVQSEQERLRLPPMPWINVLANPRFGALVSETGAGCTWSVNSHERRLTAWANDPVRDQHEEAFYLHDRDSGFTWSPAAGPVTPSGMLETRHGLGYSVFSRQCAGLQQQVQVFVHREQPIKIWRITLRNLRTTSRRLILTACQRLVLGFLPQYSTGWLQTELRAEQRLLLARNPLAGVLAGQLAFASMVGEGRWRGSCDRHDLFGTQGDLQQPVGLLAEWQSAPATGDAAFIQQLDLELPANGEIALSFMLGDAASTADISAMLATLQTDADIVAALEDVKAFWREQVGGIQVDTPSQPINLMLNGWLLYQTLACRMWGRTAFYQSSGAYGFRDQLQDCGAFALTHPQLTRVQILLHASRQFCEGDVQHWWHEPPLDAGLRTRFADDLNWLPYLTAHYLNTTADSSILDEAVPFLQGRLLTEGEDEAYFQAQTSAESASLYEHCCRALDRSLTKGAHGLPLMGTGDWNDGMNRVGREGKGESVWMGFFLYTILTDFIPLAEQRSDTARAQQYRDYRTHLATVLNDAGWDGQWYRRAYYDNGDPLGSASNDECRIDALAQAWSVLSGVASPERARQAMAATEQQLIDRDGGLIRLLTPAFANTKNDPGYIKGYVAGVRENGGQYTHAATWVVKAMATLERNDCTAALYEMLLPVTHTTSPEAVARFQAEPYVAVADVYGEPPHVGRGGWSWYTGSSGWLYRVGVESVLGLSLLHGTQVRLKPCIPAEWPGFSLRYRLPTGGTLHIEAQRQPASTGSQVLALTLDGVALPPQNQQAEINIEQSAGDHHLQVLIG